MSSKTLYVGSTSIFLIGYNLATLKYWLSFIVCHLYIHSSWVNSASTVTYFFNYANCRFKPIKSWLFLITGLRNQPQRWIYIITERQIILTINWALYLKFQLVRCQVISCQF